MLKFKTSCAVLAYLSSNLLNKVGLSFFRYFEVGLRVCDIVVKKLTFAISHLLMSSCILGNKAHTDDTKIKQEDRKSLGLERKTLKHSLTIIRGVVSCYRIYINVLYVLKLLGTVGRTNVGD